MKRSLIDTRSVQQCRAMQRWQCVCVGTYIIHHIYIYVYNIQTHPNTHRDITALGSESKGAVQVAVSDPQQAHASSSGPSKVLPRLGPVLMGAAPRGSVVLRNPQPAGKKLAKASKPDWNKAGRESECPLRLASHLPNPASRADLCLRHPQAASFQ